MVNILQTRFAVPAWCASTAFLPKKTEKGLMGPTKWTAEEDIHKLDVAPVADCRTEGTPRNDARVSPNTPLKNPTSTWKSMAPMVDLLFV